MIEVEEYVRTKNGIIDKIKTFNKYGIVTKYDDKEDKISVAINYYINSGLEVSEDDIVKHSKNIIDLLEVGDFVNGNRVYKITSACIYCVGKAVQNKLTINIETILTKEQYEQNCYKLN